eukprot:6374073-Amphidinium_carterae.1
MKFARTVKQTLNFCHPPRGDRFCWNGSVGSLKLNRLGDCVVPNPVVQAFSELQHCIRDACSEWGAPLPHSPLRGMDAAVSDYAEAREAPCGLLAPSASAEQKFHARVVSCLRPRSSRLLWRRRRPSTMSLAKVCSQHPRISSAHEGLACIASLRCFPGYFLAQGRAMMAFHVLLTKCVGSSALPGRSSCAFPPLPCVVAQTWLGLRPGITEQEAIDFHSPCSQSMQEGLTFATSRFM